MFEERKERKKRNPVDAAERSVKCGYGYSLTSRKQQPLLQQVPVRKNKVECKGKTKLYKSSDVMRPVHLYQHLRLDQKITSISFFIF